MDIPFIYYKHVSGRNFLGRTQDLNVFCNLLSNGENIVIYEAPKSGTGSLLEQAFINLKAGRVKTVPDVFTLTGALQLSELLSGIGDAILRNSGKNAVEYAQLVDQYLQGTHFVFDKEIFASCGKILSINRDVDENDIRAILTLPYRSARDKESKTVLILKEFHNILDIEGGERVCKLLEETFKGLTPVDRQAASYVFTGSKVNAMKEIFEHRHFFVRQVERVRLSTIDTRDLVSSAIQRFLATGKETDRDLLTGMCKIFRCNPWYFNHFCAICDSFSKGYIMEPIIVDALNAIISIHEPRFKAVMGDLTGFQKAFLKAVLDGVTRFSSSDIISQYGLHSSANVRRLKDALCKKEVLTFDAEDKAVILDPLFEYWAGKYYFGTTEK